jgi:hypothetical protein
MTNRISSSLLTIGVAFAAFVLTMNVSRVARAQVPAVQEAPPPRRTVSITISPIHLTLPVLELTGEFRVLDKLGLAVVVGGGKVTPDGLLGLPPPPAIPVWEAGVQARYYVLGDFRHGMQVGGELMYLHASAEQGTASAVAHGVSVGPFLGYKVMADIGFTFDCQLGYQFMGVGASGTDGQTSSSQSSSDSGVLLNLNVGWSF